MQGTTNTMDLLSNVHSSIATQAAVVNAASEKIRELHAEVLKQMTKVDSANAAFQKFMKEYNQLVNTLKKDEERKKIEERKREKERERERELEKEKEKEKEKEREREKEKEKESELKRKQHTEESLSESSKKSRIEERYTFPNSEQGPAQLSYSKTTFKQAHLNVPSLMAISSTDLLLSIGSECVVKLWKFDGENLSELGSIPKEPLRTTKYPLDAQWDPTGTLCGVLFDSNVSRQQLGFIALNSLSSLHDKVELRFCQQKPHKKAPSKLKFLNNDQIVTTGSDNTVFLWNIEEDSPPQSLYEAAGPIVGLDVHRPTGTVYTSSNKVIHVISDRVDMLGLDEKVDGVRLNPKDPNLLMIGFHHPSNPVSLCDVRMKRVVLALHNNNFYPRKINEVMPNWSPDGSLVSCGNSQFLNIWDIRNNKHIPIFTKEIHRGAIISTEWVKLTDNQCVVFTLSEDRSIGCSSLKIN